MAIKRSPGCKCCKGTCPTTYLTWTPSSPYSRGEYTDDDRWQPYTEYLLGDTFWMFALDRDGVEQKFLFTVIDPAMFSGGGWTDIEESRYQRGDGISYFDGLEDFELLTNESFQGGGWPLDQIELHAALQERKLREGQGLISRKELAKDEWIATWNVDIKATEEYDDMEMESLDVRVRFMGSAEYDPEVDDQPTSGIVTVVSKAAPEERVHPPYPEECIPSCVAEVEELWNPDDPQCGPKPPYLPEFKVEHGTFQGAAEDLDETWSKSETVSRIANARSTQPENGAVMGPMNVAEQTMFGGREEGEPLDLHDYRVLNDCFGSSTGGSGFANGFENHRIQNAVSVVTEGGEVTQGGDPFTVETGDLIKIVDFTKLDDSPFSDTVPYGSADAPEDGAFEHIPAAEIIENDRTCYFSETTSLSTIVNQVIDNDIEFNASLTSFTGGRLAVYVDKFSDTDIQRTSEGEYYCEFSENMCKIETPATIDVPQCVPIPAYECECRPLVAVMPGLDLTSIGSYDYCYAEELLRGIIPASNDGVLEITPIESSGEVDWFGPFIIPGGKGDCSAKAATGAIGQSWTLVKATQAPGLFFREIVSYAYRVQTTLVVETSRVNLLDCIGPRDKVVMARSAVSFRSATSAGGGVLSSGFGEGILAGLVGWDSFLIIDEDTARDEMNRAKFDDLADASKVAQSYLCKGRGLSFSMTGGVATQGGFGNGDVIFEDTDGDGDVDITDGGGGIAQWIAASLHEWSLQTDDQGCGYALNLDFPNYDEQENQQRFGRHFNSVATCDLISPALSFTGQASVVGTTGANIP